MAIFTSIKDVLNAKQYKLEFERLVEENKRLKNIRLTPTQMALSQIIAKTKECEAELEGYDNLIKTKTKAIEELNTEYSNQADYQTKEYEQKSNEYDNLIELKGKEVEDKTAECDKLSENKSKEYDNIIQQKEKEIQDKTAQCDELSENKRQEYEDLTESKTKEYQDLIQQKSNDLQQKSEEYNALIDAKTKSIQELNSEYNNVKRSVDSLKSQVVSLDDDILKQSYGVYKPIYNIANSEKGSEMLQGIREKQMDMIKSKEAIEFKQWIVNGSVKEDNQLLNDMTEDMIKLVVRIFNDECESIIEKVKFSNIEVIENRIKKFFDDLNKLGNITQVKIVPKYFNTKLEELYIAYEYKLKEQQEKEEKSRITE
jgi:chromosome segregation ATPase